MALKYLFSPLFQSRLLYNSGFRKFSDSRFKIERIGSRGVLKLQGTDVSLFLQGIITNDINHLVDGAKSIYSMILNSKGRIKFDCIVYKSVDECYYLETDVEAIPKLEKHLKLYKLKKDVIISHEPELQLLQVMDIKEIDSILPQPPFQSFLKSNFCLNEDNILDNLNLDDDIVVCRDPRLSALGIRIICHRDKDINDIPSLKHLSCDFTSELMYKSVRYMLGITEGANEILSEQSFPLEMNCDYLHGVSFHKGCYIGQELTARSHHTGVIRKRIMPLLLDSTVGPENSIDIFIDGEENGKSVGKLRGVEGNYGIGLLRIAECLKASALRVGNTVAHCVKPLWWPIETSKEKQVNR